MNVIDIDDWLQCKEFPIILTLKSDKIYFYCSHPKYYHWLSLSNTFGNIKNHIKGKHLLKTKEIVEANNDELGTLYDSLGSIEIPPVIDSLICNKFKSMILKTERPFSMIADPDMKSILKNLGTRQNLAEKCEEIASLIKSHFSAISSHFLSSSSFISVSLDEWSDLNGRRYLGITARCIYSGEAKVFFFFFLALALRF